MAVEAPDPKTFGSWEESFQFPITAVRGMERQLRNDVETNREKLRTLVGASYRDLLGTAESIIEMDNSIQKVESYLGGLSVRCNTRLLEKKAANLERWNSSITAPDRERYAFASQLAVLRSCPEVISRILRGGNSVLLATKVLVISRLLHKKSSQHAHSPPYLETLRSRLATLRRKLLAKIDKLFRDLDLTEAVLLDALCAFSLATSSSPTDALRHYHHVRREAISELGQRKEDHEGVFKALRLFVKTLKDFQAVVPGQLSRALENLKAEPMLKMADVHLLVELNLDIHERWLGDDINSFIPYIRYDDLQKSDTTRMSKDWATKVFSSFLNDLRSKIGEIEDPLVIIHFRQEMLDLWFSNQRYSTGVNPSDVLQGSRDVFNSRLIQLIGLQSKLLEDVGSAIDSILLNWQSGVSETHPSLWDSAVNIMDSTSGTNALREALSARAYGRTAHLDATYRQYHNWIASIKKIENMIQGLREKRWADDLDEFEDEDDLLENKQVLLSEDDPCVLQEELEGSLERDLGKLHDAFTSHSDFLPEDPAAGHKAAFLLRLWREISQNLPASYKPDSTGLGFIQALQETIAATALRIPISTCEERIGISLQNTTLQTRILWEGDPQLPILPSVWTFRLLHELVNSMNGFGADVWGSQATVVLKRRLREELRPLILKLPEKRVDVSEKMKVAGKASEESNDGAEQGTGEKAEDSRDGEERNGEKDSGEDEAATEDPNHEDETHASSIIDDTPPLPPPLSDEVLQEMRIQRLFDILYLRHATAVKNEDDPLIESQALVSEGLELEERSLSRMKRDAEAYWKRTRLLFGLLDRGG